MFYRVFVCLYVSNFTLLLLFNIVHLTNQSIFIYIRQTEPIVARHYKKKKRANTTLYKIATQTDEKREKLSRYWSETSAAEVHTYIFQRFHFSHVVYFTLSRCGWST